MSERGAKRGVGGAPFYAPPRRKTSAEIISEARAAVYGDMNSASTGSSGGVVRPIRTRRPFTPREPQRTLFTERVRKKEIRPPSAFDLKFLSVSESDESLVASGARVASLDDDEFNGVLLTEPQGQAKKKPVLRNQSRSVQERSGDGWGGFPKLPHLSGRSKPLHRRNNSHAHSDDANTETDLAETISVTRPFGKGYEYQESISENGSKSLSPEAGGGGGVRKKRFQTTKSVSCDSGNVLTEIPVKHLAVQLPNTSSGKHNSMSLLELSEALSQRNEDTDCTVRLMEALQKILEKSTPGNNLRDLVLRSLYVHIDSDDEQILVAIARAMLTMRVTGTHLAAACKLVFKIARNDKNDHFFRNTDLLELLVEGCGRADPVSEGECCVYGAGALRFLALEPSLCALALRAGALHLAALHLKILNNAKAENPRLVSEQSTHALYQLTGALRNLAGGGERAAIAFVASGALAELLAALQHHTDRDVLTNVARCLSVLSADETCCEWLCEAAASGGARSLLLALAACASRAPLAVRLAYTLGNMAAAHEQARISIYSEDGSIDVLLTILETYAIRNDNDTRDPDSDPDLHLIGTDLGGSDGSNEDVLIKTVRVVANLCLAERAGRSLAETHAERTVRALLACLKLAETPLEETVLKNKAQVMRYSERHEELATAALATLNNITFYREPPEPDPLEEPLDQLCIATCGWLRSVSNGTRSGAGCEAVRALGNLSRAHMLARRIVLEGAIDHLPAYLGHEDVSVRCAAAGVLVNVCGAGASRESAEATRVCAAALSAAAADHDAHSAALLARALWNAHSHTPLSAAQAHQATAALALFIDDESVFAACEALRGGERRASNPEISRQHVKFNLDNNNCEDEYLHKARAKPLFVKAYSVDQELHLGHISDEDLNGTSGEDLGFEEGDLLGESECECGPCRRLAAWEELVGVAIPLLEKLRPATADASVGTD